MPENTNVWQNSHAWEVSPDVDPRPVPLVAPSDLLNPMLSVADIMDSNFQVCSPGMPVVEALAALRHAESGVAPVIDGTLHGKPLGLLTERAIVTALADAQSGFFRMTVGEIMSHETPKVHADDKLEVLLERFSSRGALVVDKKGKLEGVVHWSGLAKGFSERGLGRIVLGIIEREGRQQ
jgi:CBS domain-containing protein